MATSDSPHIALQAFDLYSRIEQIHQRQGAAGSLRTKYILLRKVLEEACYELTSQETLAFDNLFARVDYLCKEKRMTPSDKYAIQTMRRHCNQAMDEQFHPDVTNYRYDLRALLCFIAGTFQTKIPESLSAEIPPSNRPFEGDRLSRIPYLRVSVTQWDEQHIFAATDAAEVPFILIDYSKFAYLHELLEPNMQLNLLDVSTDDEQHYHPSLIIVHPDYLVDISALAACFREYGHHPLNYFMNRLKPRANTAPILLGNLAGMFLDDYINERPDQPVDYTHTIRKFFASAALEFCTCPLPTDFHQQAQTQMMNIRSFVNDILPREVKGFDRHKTLLEASFICERLGLQGRTDMLQKDFKVLIEQKAGKRDEFRHHHKQDHYVQMMLYQGILMYNFGRETEDMQTFLLYSKYTDGLMREHFDETLFRESIRLRNCIVANEVHFANGKVGETINLLNTDLLNEHGTTGKLWTHYQRPQLEEMIDMLKHSTPLERAYFQRFYTFLSKEQLLSKTGGNKEATDGFSSLWHAPLAEKLESGNILMGLTICSKRKSAPGKGYDLIELALPSLSAEEDFLPNFRPGDIIIFYAYTHGQPDVRKHILMRGNIYAITAERVTVLLRNGQQNKDIIGGEGEVYAIEHDSSDVSAGNAIRGLYAFLSATEARKALLLGQRPPICNAQPTALKGDYGRFDSLISKEKQAKDYFLLVGPPGTGKTSCALRYMVEEALTDDNASLLLLSYTNRAVDEICDMLVSSGIARQTPFIRLGHELSCDKRFVPYLLKEALSGCPKLSDIREKIIRTRIVVGTTTALNSRPYLFGLKPFSLAIVDEASQILEPDLIGILSARHGEKDAIRKFILVGDYKQLPAIAQQSPEESAVDDPLLRTIGLDNCRHSLFERLYKQSPESCRSILHHQGRMHPAIAEFPNNAFYYREQLEPVPLPHQKDELPYPPDCQATDGLDRLLLTRRMAFIPVQAPADASLSEKANRNEARIVAALVARIYRHTSTTFDPHKTVGVIVPYRNQIAMIRKEIAALHLPPLADISIDTVERYQGSQRDVIIYSFTVRNFNQLNFLTSNTFNEGEYVIDRKLNVAITRARKQLFLTGDPHILGANLTFYKLMEYIRLHNGYIEGGVESFCRGDVQLPTHTTAFDLNSEAYTLPDDFTEAFTRLIEAPVLDDERTDLAANQVLGNDDTRNRELLSYGRLSFRKETSHTSADLALLYNYYYMRPQYASALALFEENGSWLKEVMRRTAGRIIFCALSTEAGASGLAFYDACRHLPQRELTYLGIHPQQAMGTIAADFFASPAYQAISASFYSSLAEAKDLFFSAPSPLSRCVMFNLSNLFDRITSQEACQLAQDINQIVGLHPLDTYILVYRDDAGDCLNDHSYKTFCSHLLPTFRSLHAHMPTEGKFYYRQSSPQTPHSSSFIYDIRISRK